MTLWTIIFSTNVLVVGKRRDDLLSADWPFEKNVNENTVIEQVLNCKTLF